MIGLLILALVGLLGLSAILANKRNLAVKDSIRRLEDIKALEGRLDFAASQTESLTSRLRNAMIERDNKDDEIQAARKVVRAVREELACEDGEDIVDRAKAVSARAAIAGAISDILEVQPGAAPDKVINLVTRIRAKLQSQEDLETRANAMMKWLGARKGETLSDAVQRVICTYEHPAGAAAELQKARAILDCSPGQTIPQALMEPWDLSAKVLLRKGLVCGVSLTSDRNWPVIGNVKIDTKELD